MRTQNYLLIFIALLIGIFFGITFTSLYQNKRVEENNQNQRIFQAVLERSNFWGDEDDLDFGHKGNWDEKPDGIEEISVSVKLIPSIDDDSTDFLVAYQAIIGLKPQTDKITKIFSSLEENYFVDGYGVYFRFYLLDEDGYCLSEICTEDKKTLHSPGTHPLSIKPGNKSALIQEVITEGKISALLASRVKKVCYWPVFSVNSRKPYKNKYAKE